VLWFGGVLSFFFFFFFFGGGGGGGVFVGGVFWGGGRFFFCGVSVVAVTGCLVVVSHYFFAVFPWLWSLGVFDSRAFSFFLSWYGRWVGFGSRDLSPGPSSLMSLLSARGP